MARTVIKPVEFTWTCETDDVDPTLTALASSAAVSYAWALSGGRVGEMVTHDAQAYAPCTGVCAGPTPYLTDAGYWINGIGLTGLGHPCCRLTLPKQPVQSVDAVRVNGSLLDPSEYVVMGGVVMRVGACWPCVDECEGPPISIDFSWGIGWDALDKLALAALACEFLAHLTGGVCRLSPRATSITRQGVTVQMGDAAKLMSEGFTGIGVVDSWIRSVNPDRLQQAPRIVGIDSVRFV